MRPTEKWQSGRMYLTRNQAYRKVPWVRIPPSPPIPARVHRYENSSEPFLFFGPCRQSVGNLPKCSTSTRREKTRIGGLGFMLSRLVPVMRSTSSPRASARAMWRWIPRTDSPVISAVDAANPFSCGRAIGDSLCGATTWRTAISSGCNASQICLRRLV